MNIKITKNIEEANCVTHSGTFHADEVFATIILSKINKDLKIIRVNNVDWKNVNSNMYVYDIGDGELDHHQLGGNGNRDNGVPYAACGLVWKKYGMDVLNSLGVENNIEEIWKTFDKDFIQYIDANDNGKIPAIDTPYKIVSLASIISNFNPRWDEDIDGDAKFIEAVIFSEKIFDNALNSTLLKVKAKIYVENAINDSKDGIMILEKYMPWHEIVLNSNNKKAKDINFVIFPSNRGGYNIYTVAKELGSFESRKYFPKTWAGLKDEKLQEVTGIKTARFCHNACFICATETKEDAIKLAYLANNSIL